MRYSECGMCFALDDVKIDFALRSLRSQWVDLNFDLVSIRRKSAIHSLPVVASTSKHVDRDASRMCTRRTNRMIGAYICIYKNLLKTEGEKNSYILVRSRIHIRDVGFRMPHIHSVTVLDKVQSWIKYNASYESFYLFVIILSVKLQV